VAALVVEKLDKKKHARETFNCGVEVLNAYLQLRANQDQKKHLNITYVVLDQEQQSERKDIIGFYTLSNSLMKQGSFKKLIKHIPASYDIPTIKLERLAVNNPYKNTGMGRFILKDVLLRVIDIASLTGLKGIEVVAKDENAANFYKKFGFIQLEDNHNLLFLPIETLLMC
jgi:GNAT superfamily N-acetyltransferase